MPIATQEKAYSLARNATVVLDDADVTTVCCRSGRLWLTQYGDSRDVVLGSGECFQIDRGTVIVVQAMWPAQLAVFQSAAPPLLAKGWRALPGRLMSRFVAPRRRAALWTHNLPGRRTQHG
jgi:hypothetical protein